MTHRLKIVTVWLVLGGMAFVAVEEVERRREQTRFTFADGTVEIHRAADGHYHWPGRINGHSVDFLVDTGATRSTMSRALAEQLGLTVDGKVQTTTANGVVIGGVARVDIDLRGGIEARRLKMVVLPSLGDRPLLGMDVLGRLNLRQRGGVLRIDADDAGK